MRVKELGLVLGLGIGLGFMAGVRYVRFSRTEVVRVGVRVRKLY